MLRLKQLGLRDLHGIQEAVENSLPPAFSPKRMARERAQRRLSVAPLTGRVSDDEVLFKTPSERAGSAPKDALRELGDLVRDTVEKRASERPPPPPSEPDLEELSLEDLDGVDITGLDEALDSFIERAGSDLSFTAEDEGSPGVDAARREQEERPFPLTRPPRSRQEGPDEAEPEEEPEGRGILWDEDGIYAYPLGDDAKTIPERELRWITPAEGEEGILVEGRRYQLHEGEDGPDGALRCLRIGEVLSVWSDSLTTPNLLEDFGVMQYLEVDWPANFVRYEMNELEASVYATMLPEDKPVLLHPIPDDDTKHQGNLELRSIHHACHDHVMLGERSFYVIKIGKIPEWFDSLFWLPRSRLAVRSGNSINVWGMNGGELFKRENVAAISVSPRRDDEPLPGPLPSRGRFRPYDVELAEISDVYPDDPALPQHERIRHLYPLPQDIGEMEAGVFMSLLTAARKYVDKKGHSPLLSIRGRWYIASEYSYPGSVPTLFEDDMIVVNPEKEPVDNRLDRIKFNIRQRREDAEGSVVTLPSETEQRIPLIRLFPKGESRYLLRIDEEVVSEAPEVVVTNGEGTIRYLVFEEPEEGTFEVVRHGNTINKVDVVTLPSEPAQRAALSALFPVGRSRYLLHVDMDVISEAPDVVVTDDQGTIRYLVFDEPREGAFEVTRAGDKIMRV